ncbi:solute carrier family 39 [Thecamonas trahens ATCC 50062]|uniref:Zinc transporter ZIP11 n=1 Tax=Thecamonas trahens ATCC 50062 TaxID=461836 RepID=A0A0L0DLE8_THETB|nr:solute carrier family 39 [Thecamonas trahens ATCC 50062]KNC53164.1 solute carrier family 39 [Thecamonas trahens ATCC 50062]|eukprot:XP_013754637.1 solute carrier family 39 [Thecamonas trahens ATCC 50062]
MIEGAHPVTQALLGTLLTWGLTAFGAAVVFAVPASAPQATLRKVLDVGLGFAAGVMIAASFWSLLAPAIELAEESGAYGQDGAFAFVPVAIGFTLGAAFVAAVDAVLPDGLLAPTGHDDHNASADADADAGLGAGEGVSSAVSRSSSASSVRSRAGKKQSDGHGQVARVTAAADARSAASASWRRTLLLLIAITAHNAPEGMAVGVGFAAVGRSPKATLASAQSLALGIGIQNWPEGLAVSLPLLRAGMSPWRAFFWGQASGMVEPVFGLLGAFAYILSQAILPYALAFAAGAMIFVVPATPGSRRGAPSPALSS